MRREAVMRDDAPPPPPASHPSIVERLQAHAARPVVRTTALVLVLGFFAIHAIVVARTDTPTVDEFVYVPAGYYHLRTGDLSFGSTNPPLMKMAMALPLLAMPLELDVDPHWRDDSLGWAEWTFGTRFMEVNKARYLSAYFAARMVVLVLAVVLGVLLFRRAVTLVSPLAAIATLVLYGTMSPLIAHSALATLDVGVTLPTFAAFLALERFTTTKSWTWAGVAGVLVGVAFAAKGTAILFVPVMAVLVAFGWGAWNRDGLRRLAVGTVAAVVGTWIAVLVAWGFTGFPLPKALVDGVRFQMAASGGADSFLNGRWSKTGFWYYYLEAFVLKTPLASLGLFALGTAVVLARRLRGRGDAWVLAPPYFLLYVMSFHFGKNYGVRYLLPAFPFFLLLAGHGVDALLRAGKYGVGLVGALLAWQLVACTAVAPYHLAYFNELVRTPDEARRFLLDSNLDWGQDLGRLKTYLDGQGTNHICLGYFGHVDPHLYGIEYSFPPTAPRPVRCAISANFLGGYPYAITYAGEKILGVKPNVWAWFDRYQPVARVGRSIYVFDLTGTDVGAP
jgi:4-amino-4-deoxy-L-arabinose transferase-like glycosyltransferase